MRFALIALLPCCLLSPAPAQPKKDNAEVKSRVYQGPWQNQKRGTSGTLRCTARTSDGKNFKATFEGNFRREKFSYNVEFTATGSGAKKQLKGTARIGGDNYRWAGVMQANTLVGRFQSQRQGNYGQFNLKAVAGK